MKTAIITGIGGMDGYHLSCLLLSKGYRVIGVYRRTSSSTLWRLADIPNYEQHMANDRLILEAGDVTDLSSIARIVAAYEPVEFYNLAAQSLSADALCPFLMGQSITYRTLEDVWNALVAKDAHIINTKDSLHNLDVEVIEIDNQQLRALGMWQGMGTFMPVTQISRHKFKGQLAHMNQKFGCLQGVTPNHSILDAQQMPRLPSDNPWLLCARTLNYVGQRSQFQIDGFHPTRKEIAISDTAYRNKHGHKLERFLEGDTLKAFLRVAGAFIAEGSTCLNSANGQKRWNISNTDKTWLENLENDLNMFYHGPRHYSIHKKDGCKDVYQLNANSSLLYESFRKLFGDQSINKRIPGEILTLKKEFLEELFMKMIEGDGCASPYNGWRYTTSSRMLAHQFSMLLSLLGYLYTVHLEEHNDNPKWNPAWHFRTCQTHQPRQGNNTKKIRWVDYDGYVYDIAVAECENFATGVGNIVVHNSQVWHSFKSPISTSEITGIGALNCLEAVRQFTPNCRFYQASSSEMFGNVAIGNKAAPLPNGKFEVRLNEDSPMVPRSPYGCAKLFAHNMVRNYREAYNMFAVGGVLFNHESEYRGVEFVTRKITDGIAKILAAEQEVIKLGNLDAYRDWGYAGDYMNAAWTMLQQNTPKDYVIATGQAHSIKKFAELAFSYVGVDDWQSYIEIDPDLYRAAEIHILVGDATKARQELGWSPTCSFKQLVYNMTHGDLLRKGIPTNVIRKIQKDT